MRHLMWWTAAWAVLASVGCGGSGSNSPLAPSASNPQTPAAPAAVPVTSVDTALGSVYQSGDLATSALGIYTVEVNPETLQATSELKQTRAGQANDDLYFLSIDSFLNAGSFKITGVSADANNITLDYIVTHPFPAPSDPTGTPNGSTNRADLGITGMVMFMADVPSATGNTYFTDRVANTALVTNADAYFSPGGLLTSSATANTFPYRQLVDEVADARDGVSNGGDVTGNFGTDGWTRSEFGAENNGWTGYGALHQGQAAASTVSFDKDELSGGFSLDVAIVAKYNDPRGGATPAQKKANRLPPATADASLFAYRMPHGALDAAAIVVEDEPAGFIANTISAAQVSMHVVDWDARATETTEADLSDDASFTNVAVGESGNPTVEVCIPGILGDATSTAPITTVVDDDSAYGGDAGTDSGAAGDALFYSTLVTKAAGTGQTDGDFTGMARVTDPETDLAIYLDESLAPLATPPLDVVTYQAFTVTQLPDNAPPTATVVLTSGNPLNSGTPASVAITSIADADSDNLDISVDWGNGGGFVSVVTGLPSPYANQTPSSPNMNNVDLTPDTINVVVRVDDGTVQVDYPLSYTLGPNRAPQVTGTRSLASASLPTPASFTMNAGTGTATDPEGDAVSYTITNNANGDQPTFAAFPNAANTTPIVPTGAVNFTVYANDALHPTTSGTAYPVVVGTVVPAGPTGWLYRGLAQSASSEFGQSIAIDGSGNVYIIGSGSTGTDFGGGARTALTGAFQFLVKLNSSGAYQWDKLLDTADGFEAIWGLDTDNAGNVYVAGYWRGTLDMGGGPRLNNQTTSAFNYDIYVAKYNSAGTYVWDAVSNGEGNSDNADAIAGRALAVDKATGDVYHTGKHTRTEQFGAIILTNAAGATAAGTDPYLVKLNSAGTVVWAEDFTPSALSTSTLETGQSVAVGPAGECYVGGFFQTGMDFGGGARTAILSSDAFVSRRNPATGAWIWDRVYGSTGTTGTEYACAIAADATNVYVAGRYYNNTDFGGGLRPAGLTGADGSVVAYGVAAGAYAWDRTFYVAGNATTDEARGLGLSGTDLFVGAVFNSTTDFGGGLRTTLGSTDIGIVKLTTAGAYVSDLVYGTAGLDQVRDLRVAGTESYSTGSHTNTIDFDPGPGTANSVATSSDFWVVNLLSGLTF